jgi:hypothetical protein
MKRANAAFGLFAWILVATLSMAVDNSNPASINGYVIDSACAFTKNLKKPASAECAIACAKKGSPLVILSDDGNIYWPIDENIPASSQNQKLLPFAGQKVMVSGKVFQRGGSTAIVIEKIQLLPSAK